MINGQQIQREQTERQEKGSTQQCTIPRGKKTTAQKHPETGRFSMKVL